MNRVKRMVSTENLKTLYYSLVQSYVTYGIILWGKTYETHLNAIKVCQKKAVRCIYKTDYNAHTRPLFEQSGILPFEQLYRLDVSKLMFR